MRAFQFVKSAISRSSDDSESRLSKEFEGKKGNEIVDMVSHKQELKE